MKHTENTSRKTKRPKRVLLTYFWSYTKGSRHLLFLILGGMLLDGLLQAGVVHYLKILIDELSKDPGTFIAYSLGRMILFGILAAFVFFPVAYVGHFAFSILASRLVTAFRMALYRHLQCLSIGFFNREKGGEITTRLTQDVDNGVQIMVGFVTGAAWALGMLLTALVSMLYLSVKLTLLFVVLNAIYYAIWRVLREKIANNARAVRDHTGMVTAFATEDVSVMMMMKTFAREQRFYNRFNQAQEQLYRAQVQAARINFIFTDTLQAIGKFLAPVAILGVGALLVERDGLSIGTLVAFWSYWGLVQGPLNVFYGAGPGLASCTASIDRIMDFFEQQPTPSDKPRAIHFQPKQGHIEFRNVTFAYPGESKPIFSNLSFSLPPNTSLGIVGPSGAGKSTLVQLTLRFYDPQQGCIRIDGIDLRDMTQASLRKATGVVLQESLLLSGSIRENLLLGDESATDARIWAALAKAGADDFVRNLEAGLDTTIGERGITLSGGQRQRLSIARVFLKDPPLVIFDEATSALDSATESLIQESTRQLLKGRSAMIIAHRLSTIIDCDNILMLKDGQVLGLAPHAKLLETCPEYEKLVSKQYRNPDKTFTIDVSQPELERGALI